MAGPLAAAEVALALVHLDATSAHADAWPPEAQQMPASANPAGKASRRRGLPRVARYRLAEGRAKAASEMIARARHGWSPPGWLDHTLTLLESRAYAAAGDLSSAVGTAERAQPGACIDATVALAHALAGCRRRSGRRPGAGERTRRRRRGAGS